MTPTLAWSSGATMLAIRCRSRIAQRTEQLDDQIEWQAAFRRPAEKKLYAIVSRHGNVKLGRSTDPDRRLADFQGAHAYPLRLYAVAENGDLEGFVHRSLWAHRLSGEWFRWCQPVQRFVETYYGVVA